MSDTIAALASGRTPAGVAVIRVSGHDAYAVVDKMVDSPCATQQPGTARLVSLYTLSERSLIDQSLRLIFRNPKSFTGEDVVELQIHGGLIIIDEVLEQLYAAGARPANRGEFSERAFLNGKIDLTQAEAISDIISAPTRGARELASMQLGGILSEKINAVERLIQSARVMVEASIDFPEDVGEVDHLQLSIVVVEAMKALQHLQQTARRGQLMRHGAKVVLIGAPNVGKSSLLNALAGRDRAIVSPIAGTTRDTIDIQIDIEGIPVTLTDTAGLRDTPDAIERIGIDRTHLSAMDADIIIALSCSESPSVDFPDIHRTASVIRVQTKSDLDPNPIEDTEFLSVSTVTGAGLEMLTKRIANQLFDGTVLDMSNDRVAINARHSALITLSIEALSRVMVASGLGIPSDLLAVDLHDAALHLANISGRNVIESMHQEVFSRFCIGK